VTPAVHARRLGAGLALGLLALGGCAAHARAPEPTALAARTPLVLLPLENLSGRAEYGERFTRLAWSVVGASGRFDLVDPGQVDAVLVEFRIRSSGAVTREQILKLASRLNVRWVLAGSLLECGTVRTPDGDAPTFSLALRLIDGHTGKVVWTDLRARSGEDREIVFGWGREQSLDRLAEVTTRELVNALRVPDAAEVPDTLTTSESKP